MSLTTTIPTIEELNSYQMIAKVAASNMHWRKLGGDGTMESIVSTILSVMLLARELGISPMQAISGGINNVQGKFEISARIMNQLMRRHGHKIQVKILTDKICTIWGKRKDTGEEMTATYTIEEASRAGLIKSGSKGPGAWLTVPQDMLFARCISRLARRLAPDCIGGCYVEGELQETVLGKQVETIDVPSSQEMKPEIEEQPIVLTLPDGINSKSVDNFIEQSALECNLSIEAMKKRASKNMDGFLKVFKDWEKKLTNHAEKVENLFNVEELDAMEV